VYDGLLVPMVGAFKGNRRILAGFMGFEGYAGFLVFRELVQHTDGSLGMKWPEEMRPKTGDPIALAPLETSDGERLGQDTIALQDDSFAWARIPAVPGGFHLSLRVTPGAGVESFGLGMFGRQGPYVRPTDIGWQLRFLPGTKQVQWETPERQAPRASAMDLGENRPWAQGDFAISEVNGIDRSFPLELIVRHDRKSGRSIVDAMINGERTIVTSRHLPEGKSPLFFYVNKGAVRFDQIQVRPLAE
jgi:hypothetical protein